jgi:hypothetical protein
VLHRGEKRGTTAHRKRGRGEQREDLLTEGGKERWPRLPEHVGDGGRRWLEIAGGVKRKSPVNREQRELAEDERL